LNDVEASNFALDHHDILLGFNSSLLVVDVLALFADVEHVVENLFGTFFGVPKPKVNSLPQELKQSKEHPIVEVAGSYALLSAIGVSGLNGAKSFDPLKQTIQYSVEGCIPRFFG
jgi:hypothetical protein